jgi:hypothetical protein
LLAPIPDWPLSISHLNHLIKAKKEWQIGKFVGAIPHAILPNVLTNNVLQEYEHTIQRKNSIKNY